MPRRPTIDPDIFGVVRRNINLEVQDAAWRFVAGADAGVTAQAPLPPAPPQPTERRLDRFGLVEGSLESITVGREIRALQERLRRRDTRRVSPTEEQRLQRAIGARKERLRLVHWLRAVLGIHSYSGNSVADMVQRRDHWARLSGSSERGFESDAAEQETARCPRADRDLPW